MKRALELATNGSGAVSPNPMVGCVITYNDQIIGEGWHRKYGGPHAEVNAINSVHDKSLLSQSTVYVSLEPCSHFGKTPPCADLLVDSKVKRVVICNLDPNPEVAGKGIKKLRENGIEVETGILEEEGENLNRRFFAFHRKKRPFIILKWAETSDGFVARENFDSKWISNEHSRQLVHQWRAEEDAILVGKNTALYDNPSLTVRDSIGENPIRIVTDHHLMLPEDLILFDQKVPTLCFNLNKTEVSDNLEYIRLEKDCFERKVLDVLFQRKIVSLIIEGGSTTINSFIALGLWDEARVFKSKETFKNGVKSPQLINAQLMQSTNIMGDQLFIYKRQDE